MQGRNGVDALAKFENKASIVCLIAGLVFSIVCVVLLRHEAYTAATVFRILNYVFFGVGILLAIHCFWRMFSRNISKRQAENTRYLYRRQRIARFFSAKKQAWKDRKTYKYFKCPKCGQRLRAPRKKGKIRVTCSKCSNIFIYKT
jgi:predicted RNA-binding Zn-ribbon protein involved in translation (DUF1610 family)